MRNRSERRGCLVRGIISSSADNNGRALHRMAMFYFGGRNTQKRIEKMDFRTHRGAQTIESCQRKLQPCRILVRNSFSHQISLFSVAVLLLRQQTAQAEDLQTGPGTVSGCFMLGVMKSQCIGVRVAKQTESSWDRRFFKISQQDLIPKNVSWWFCVTFQLWNYT